MTETSGLPITIHLLKDPTLQDPLIQQYMALRGNNMGQKRGEKFESKPIRGDEDAHFLLAVEKTEGGHEQVISGYRLTVKGPGILNAKGAPVMLPIETMQGGPEQGGVRLENLFRRGAGSKNIVEHNVMFVDGAMTNKDTTVNHMALSHAILTELVKSSDKLHADVILFPPDRRLAVLLSRFFLDKQLPLYHIGSLTNGHGEIKPLMAIVKNNTVEMEEATRLTKAARLYDEDTLPAKLARQP